MAEFVKVAVDAMGGDNAPVEIVKGAIEAVNEDHRVKVFLVGQEEVVKAELTKYTYPEEQVEVVNATEIIETASHLIQFAKMGSVYMEYVMGVKNPKVAIVNIGAEEDKGNALVKETYPLLKNCPDINFVGNIEARDIPEGKADVIVCEAFVGNVILKMYEGVGGVLIKKVKEGMMTSLRSKIGALLVKPALKNTLKAFDLEQYGGAPMLGLNGLVVKTHGSSKAVEIKNSVLQCITFKEQNINEKIKEKITMEES